MHPMKFLVNIWRLDLRKIFNLCMLVLLVTCAKSPRYRVETDGPRPPETPIGFSQTGYASYYGTKYHGKKTASGEVFDMYKMTAAHRSLPFFTKLKVTNLENNKVVLVVVNDRGPFIEGRIIDLSYEAAKRIDLLEKGVVKVKIEVVP